MSDSFDYLTATIDLEKYLLECRRHEKNFILRKDTSYLQLHSVYYDSLIKHIEYLRQNKKQPIITTQLEELQTVFIDYKIVFNEIAKFTAENDCTQSGYFSLLDQEVDKARRCHALIADIRQTVTEQFKTADSTGKLVNLGAILFGILVAVVLAGFISDKIIQFVELPASFHRVK